MKKEIKEQAQEEPKEVVVGLEETERILDQLFENGYATLEISVVPKRVKATLRSLGADAQLDLEQFMSTVEGSPAFVLHTYSKKLLEHTLLKYKEQEFESTQAVSAVIGKLSGSLLHKMVTAQNYFERQIRKATEVDEIEKHFFGVPSTPEE